MRSSAPVYSISLPEYTVEQRPDTMAVGTELDGIIKANLSGRRIAIRGIGLIDHPDLSLDELVATILETGTDRYDPEREGLYYPDPPPVVDLYAEPCVVAERLRPMRSKLSAEPSLMAKIVGLFYAGALADRGYSVRLDVVMLYDLDQLEQVPEGDPGTVTYAFRYPDQRQRALIGIITIGR